MLNINMKNLEWFVAIVDEGTLTKAAEKVYSTQPSLSRLIVDLENQAKCTLFDKSKSKMSWILTEEGHIFYKHAKHILMLNSTMEKKLHSINKFTYNQNIIGEWNNTIFNTIDEAIIAGETSDNIEGIFFVGQLLIQPLEPIFNIDEMITQAHKTTDTQFYYNNINIDIDYYDKRDLEIMIKNVCKAWQHKTKAYSNTYKIINIKQLNKEGIK